MKQIREIVGAQGTFGKEWRSATLGRPSKILCSIDCLENNCWFRAVLKSLLKNQYQTNIIFIITPTNHNRSKQVNEPIRIPSCSLQRGQNTGKMDCAGWDQFWFGMLFTAWTSVARFLSQSINVAIDHFIVVCLVAWPLNENESYTN